jgi:hypothetical protein
LIGIGSVGDCRPYADQVAQGSRIDQRSILDSP